MDAEECDRCIARLEPHLCQEWEGLVPSVPAPGAELLLANDGSDERRE